MHICVRAYNHKIFISCSLVFSSPSPQLSCTEHYERVAFSSRGIRRSRISFQVGGEADNHLFTYLPARPLACLLICLFIYSFIV
jgi:hypothetical protein